MKKRVYTLCVDDYPEEITNLTFPLFKRYAHKIGAEFCVISERKFPEFPPAYEKLQIYELGKDVDWNIFFDADALISPDFYDITVMVNKDTVVFNGKDMSANRFRPDKYFLRDGRFIGACNWLAVASDWCIDLWKPLDDLTLEEALSNIFPILMEEHCEVKITPEHLIDDYVLSRNIAKYGLKHDTVVNISRRLGREFDNYFYHEYTIDINEKYLRLRDVCKSWGLL